AIRARRRDDTSGERRRVQAMLGRADPVSVDGLHVTWVGLATPPEEKLLGGCLAARNHIVGDDVRLSVGETRGARDDRHHLRREPAAILTRLVVGDLVQLAELPLSGEPRRLGLEICGRPAGEARRLVRLGIRLSAQMMSIVARSARLADGKTDVVPDDVVSRGKTAAEKFLLRWRGE